MNDQTNELIQTEDSTTPQVTVRKFPRLRPVEPKNERLPLAHQQPAESEGQRGGSNCAEEELDTNSAESSSVSFEKRGTEPSIAFELAKSVMFYSAASNSWWVRGSDGFVQMDKTLIRKELVALGLNQHAKESNLSEIDRFLIETNKNAVHYSGALAGHPAGLQTHPNGRILVTQSCQPLTGREGPCQVILRWLEDLTGNDERQFKTLLYWLHLRRKAVLTNSWRPSQLLVLAGPAGCGKSFLQSQIITPLLGGRIARPYRYMAGGTDFNADLFSAEHLAIEDESPSRDLQSRRRLGAHIKSMLFSKVQSCHPKGRTPIHLAPIWAMTLSVNEEPENLMVLPPMDESLADKIIILRCKKPTLPVQQAIDEMQTLLAMVQQELPTLAHHVDQLTIPPEFAEPRTGLASFHNKEVMEALNGLSPEAKLDQIINASILKHNTLWRGKALDLENILTGHDSPWRREAERLFTYNSACGVYLGVSAILKTGES